VYVSDINAINLIPWLRTVLWLTGIETVMLLQMQPDVQLPAALHKCECICIVMTVANHWHSRHHCHNGVVTSRLKRQQMRTKQFHSPV